MLLLLLPFLFSSLPFTAFPFWSIWSEGRGAAATGDCFLVGPGGCILVSDWLQAGDRLEVGRLDSGVEARPPEGRVWEESLVGEAGRGFFS